MGEVDRNILSSAAATAFGINVTCGLALDQVQRG